MTDTKPPANDFECPNCSEWLSVPLPYSKNVECPWCKKTLEIHPDAEFEDGFWRDRTELSVVDDDIEHRKRMLEYAKTFQHK